MAVVRRLYVLVLFLLSPFSIGWAQGYTTVVVFGDSLSDTGNVARLTSNQYLTRIPGPLADYTDGRFTDGPDTVPAAKLYKGVWIEQLAASFPAKPAIQNSLDGGTNYAYGYGTTANGTSTLSFAPTLPLSVQVNNLGQQVTDYLATAPSISSSTLFVVWGGANDLLSAGTTADVLAAANREVTLVQRLVAAGATDFLIPNLPPLGLIPRNNGSAPVSTAANQAALAFNQALAAGLTQLPAANPGKVLRLYTLDTYALFNSIVGPPLTGGITNATASSRGNATINPDTYLFWDDLHPTTTGHSLIALAASRLLAGTPVPTTTSLRSSNLNVNLNSTISFTATVTPSSGTVAPTGTVTLLDGATVLGSSAVTGTNVGTATFTTAGLSAGTHTITASFSGVNGFGSSTSSAITEIITAPAVKATLSPSTVTVLSAGTGGSTLQLNAVGGFTGTVAYSCGTLPAHFSCNFSPTSTTLSSTVTSAAVTLNVGTARTATAYAVEPSGAHGLTWALVALPFAGLLTYGGARRRRGKAKLPHLLLMALLTMGLAAGLGGCAADNASAAPGTYVIPVNVVANSTTTALNLTVIVQ